MEKPRILIVEDEKVIIECMKVILTQEGYNVSGFVTSGEEAVEIVLKTRPDLILMDIKLRGQIDGVVAYEEIRKYVDIPAIFVSTCADDETIERAMRSGPFLAKPFKNEQLIETVKESLQRHRSQ